MKMDLNIKVNGKMESQMEKESLKWSMEIYMMVHLLMEEKKDLVDITSLMDQNIKDNSRMII